MLERPLDQLRRDVRFFLGGFVGEVPPPFFPRRKKPRPLEGREVLIERVDRPAVDSVSLRLVDPTGSRIEFEAGQFFTLLVEVDGVFERRAYSASSAPGDGPGVTLTVRRVPGGRVSNALVDGAHEGQRLRLLGPSGAFVPPDDAEELVLVAGGSGITPIASIVHDRLARSVGGARLVVVYGHRSLAQAAFAPELAELARTHRDRFRMRLVLERLAPGDGVDAVEGRLDAETLRSVLAELDALGPASRGRRAFMLCGPRGMMDGARAMLLGEGVGARDLLEERFASPGAPSMTARLPSEPVQLVVRRRGKERALLVMPGQTLLEAATSAGVELPYSCTMGGCGACRARLVDGEVSSVEPSCLSEEERADGHVLSCVSRPLRPCVLEVE